MSLFQPFFPLTSSFFGLTSEYKKSLLEEIWLCTQYMKNMSYSDVLAMPTYERRFFLSLLTKDAHEKEERMEQMRENAKTTGKGTKKRKISGDNLKNQMKNGNIPLN